VATLPATDGAARRRGDVRHNGRVHGDDDSELLSRVGELRAADSGPKQVARALALALGLRPAYATALNRRVARAGQADTAPGAAATCRCLGERGLKPRPRLAAIPGWAADDSEADEEAVGSGFAQLLFARRERASRVTVCGLLADQTVVLDSQGVSAWIAQDRKILAMFQVFHAMGADFVIGANTIVEVSHVRVNMPRLRWVLSRVKVEPVTEHAAKASAELLKAADLHGHKYAIDATAAEMALRQPGPVAILTSDLDDMARLCGDRVRLIGI
jgi:hypothetical protein